jgi:hypothetical protein
VRYKPVTDVPGIETSAIDMKELEPMMKSVIEAIRFALQHRNNFKRTIVNESELISILRSQLLLYKTTHYSLRIILREAYNEDLYSIVPDATSLVREQIEKIYIISLFLDNPSKWIMRYSRTAWRQEYERYLLELEEYGGIERHQTYLTKHYPEYLANTQRLKVRNRTEVVVSDFAKRVLTHRWQYPGDEKPAWFVKSQKGKKKKSKTLRGYTQRYFEFPTPATAASTIKSKRLKYFLFRWHREYARICEYSHVAFGKILIPTMSADYKDYIHAEKTEINGKKLAEETAFLSLISAATSCALVVNALKNPFGSQNELRNFWEILYSSSLLAKGFWNMYVKTLLK